MSGTTAAAAPSTMLQRLYAERQSCIDFIDQTIAGANVEGQTRDLSTTEQESLTRQRERITELDAQITPLEEFEQLRSAGNAAAQNYRPTPAGTPADRATGLGAQVEQRSWSYPTAGHAIVDQLRAAPSSVGGYADADARERLLSAGMVYAGVNDDDVALAQQARQVAMAAPEIRALQITDDTPGILPVPIIGDIMSDVDGARPFVSSVGSKSMAFPGKTFERPVVTQHTAVGEQTTEGTSSGLGSQKMVINGVPFNKRTFGGWLDVSRQDIDWTSPAVWNAILSDLQEQYGLQTENAAADDFATAVTAQVELAGDTLLDWLIALYAAAALAYSGAGRLPDNIWMSLDMWATVGPIIDSQVATNKNPGTSSLASFSGMLTDLPRTVVPSFAAGTVIIGAKRWTEVYEERIGVLQAVQPSVLGVQVAHGGYMANNTLKTAAFAKVVNLV